MAPLAHPDPSLDGLREVSEIDVDSRGQTSSRRAGSLQAYMATTGAMPA